MIKGIDHVAIAVENLNESLALFENVFGLRATHRETIDDYHVEVATISLAGTDIELVAGTHNDSPIKKFIEKRGPGIHHIALEVQNIVEAITALGQGSVDMIDSAPRRGKAGSKVAFVHPGSAGKVLWELVENQRGQDG